MARDDRRTESRSRSSTATTTASPAVSIVVNNFNYGQFVGPAIESALGQSSSGVEVIVVDDGSTDGSREVIDGFGDRIQKVFKPNGGQASAFNAGFERARGEIVIFLDSDDLLLPGAAAAAQHHLRGPNVVKAHWPLWVIDAQGARTGDLKPKEPLAEGDLRDLVIRRGPIATGQPPSSGNAWSRRFLEQVLPLPEHADKHGADGFLRKLAPIYGSIARIGEPQGCYRRHRNNRHGRDALSLVHRALERYPTYCRLLASHLERQGVAADVEAWTGAGSEYAWLRDAVAFQREVSAIVPAGGRFILIDGGSFGPAFFPHHHAVPFLERGGEYGGRPGNDEEASAELLRSSAAGADHLAVAFTAFWWLDAYPRFFRELGARSFCAARTPSVMVYDLGRRPASTQPPSGDQVAAARATRTAV
jgi:glycosyl transferase family 2